MKKSRLLAALIAAVPIALAASAPSNAALPHLVRPGETLWSIAAANNLTTRTVAAYNGLSVDAHLIAGRTIMVPTVVQGAAALSGAGTGAPAQTSPVSAPPPQGAYIVRRGDTLSAIAARSGVRVSQVAWMNGLNPSRPLLAGTPLKLPTGSALANRQPVTTHAVSTPSGGGIAPRPRVIPPAAPYPTGTRTTSGQIGQIAAANGVPASLAAAVGWQESGFNNGMVSSANARGVMQVMPGTWQWIQQHLAQSPLDPASTHDNVKAGVLYLRQLLNDSGGDPRMAVAGYYQGLGSVRARGMLPSTQRYVDNVLALRGRFGGP